MWSAPQFNTRLSVCGKFSSTVHGGTSLKPAKLGLCISKENQAPVDMRIIDSSKCLFTLLETGVRDMVRAVSVTSSFAEVSR